MLLLYERYKEILRQEQELREFKDSRPHLEWSERNNPVYMKYIVKQLGYIEDRN